MVELVHVLTGPSANAYDVHRGLNLASHGAFIKRSATSTSALSQPDTSAIPKAPLHHLAIESRDGQFLRKAPPHPNIEQKEHLKHDERTNREEQTRAYRSHDGFSRCSPKGAAAARNFTATTGEAHLSRQHPAIRLGHSLPATTRPSRTTTHQSHANAQRPTPTRPQALRPPHTCTHAYAIQQTQREACLAA